MEVDKFILTEALSAITGVTVKLESDCKYLERAIELQITNLPSLCLLNHEATKRAVKSDSCLTSSMNRLNISDRKPKIIPKKEIESFSLRKQLFVISDDFFDPAFDFDFTKMTESKADSCCTRGYEPYKRPYGWMRFALKVWDKYPDGTAWLGDGGWRNRSSRGEWPVSYHGTDLKGAEGIIQSQYLAGDGQVYGRGIYSSPDINVADVFAKFRDFTSEKNGNTYKVVMQNRINPKKREVKGDKIWLIPIPEGISSEQEKEIVKSSIRPYGLLLRKV